MLPNHMIGWSLALGMLAKCVQEGVQADHRTQILVIGRFEWCGTTLALVVVCPEPLREGGPRGPQREEDSIQVTVTEVQGTPTTAHEGKGCHSRCV